MRLAKLPLLALLTSTVAVPMSSSAQTTNWVAYNDHRPFTTQVSPPSWGATATNATRYNMGAPGDLPASPLNDFRTGNPLPATVSFTRTGAPDDFGAIGRPVLTNTPMARIFYGICDLANDGVIGVRATNSVPSNATESYVTMTVAGLDPSKRYVYRGDVTRNGGYGTRWSVATLSAEGWTDAHINGNGGPGVLTGNTFPASGLNPGQAAWNSGANNEGAVVGWNDIAPFADGTFTIVCKQYTGAIPGGTATGNAQYGYSFGAMMLAEVEIVAPTIISNPPASTIVEQNRPFSLSVVATGAPLNYQWYKEGQGAIANATFPTYSVSQAQLSDSGTYYAVVYNGLARRTSAVAQVTVFADTTAPTIETVFSYPTVDFNGAGVLDQVIIEFSEPVTSNSVSSAASYTVSGRGNPVSVVVTNERSVVLTLGSPLGENTEYSVSVSGAADPAGNVAGSSSRTFLSWMTGPGNGLLMESFNVEDTSIIPESVLADSDYPNNPFRRDSLRAFDSRLVFPDDSQEGYGARIRGVFIPPVSGDWKFFARTRNLGVLYLNPNGIDEAGKREILRQSTENAPFNWDRLQSSLIPLRAGRAYYIEGLYKGATGPDYLKVAARLAGTGVPTPVDTPDTQVDTNSLSGGIIAFPFAPRDLGGTLSIVQNPASMTADENNRVTFSVEVSNPSGLPLHYQWFRDGNPISGATLPTYTLRPTVAADNGATFSVRVAKPGSTVTSQAATLTVRPDTNAPRVIDVQSSSTNLSSITVRFNESMNQIDAQDTFGYSIAGFNITNAALQADEQTVILSLETPLTVGTSYDLSFPGGIRDLANNALEATNVTFRAGGELPRLTVSLSANQAVISWPAPSTGFVLEQADALVAPISWSVVGTPPTVVNGRNTVTVNASAVAQFYRLRQ
jgi:hypothetical protein